MKIKNVAIIAHVDHGKTTLVDNLLKQSGTFREHQNVSERAMDSNDLERERGITILAKCTSIAWKDGRINIVDTPGHADFGGEVERILSMVDGVIVLVDAAEGPMPQTKFVLGKALKLGLRPIVVINKADRPDSRADEVLDEIFDLFVMLEANDDQLDFPVMYASGRDGWAVKELGEPQENLHGMMDLIQEHVPSPDVDPSKPFAMLSTIQEYDSFLGRILTGRIQSGKLTVNQSVKVLTRDGEVRETGRVTKILVFRGLERVSVDSAEAGDIVAIAGLADATVSDTICEPNTTAPLPSTPIDPPTLSMTFSINDSPLAGQEGKSLTSRVLGERLMKEAESNVAIRVTQTADRDAYEVAGRGELQLGVLIETMRREGFELSVSRPQVIYRYEDGKKLEPIEDVQIDVDDAYSGTVVESMNLRKGELQDMRQSNGKTRIRFFIPARGLIGYHGQFLTETRGTGVMNRIFHDYAPYKGSIEGRRRGVLISNGDGEAVGYALFNLEDRGQLMISPGTKVYQGMIIGEHSRENDLEVNPLKGKQLTNVRASGKDEAIKLTTPRTMSLEEALAYIEDDERVEVTPENIRIRKVFLCPNERKKQARQKED